MESLTPSLAERLASQLRLAAAARALAPQLAAPYFGHMRVESGGRTRDILLGGATRTSPELAIVDWRTAPLAEVFFAVAEGEPYELELDERTLAGRLVERNLVRFEGAELAEVVAPGVRLERTAEGWRARPAGPAALAPRPPAAQKRPLSPMRVALDPAQRRVVELPPKRSVLILGEAGFGKTTVALHRLVHLRRSARRPISAAVIVPTEGLRRLTALMLEREGLEGVEVWQYDRWAASMARAAFARLPAHESQDTTAGVMRLKRHPALREVLPEIARRKKGAVQRKDLHHLFGDSALMRRVAAAAAGALNPDVPHEIVEHTHVQFSPPAEKEFAHVDADRLETLDGRTIDEGTPMGDAGTIDAEDYAVLFELDRLRAGSAGRKPQPVRRYDVVVVDEAQELAPLELALLRRAIAPGGVAIVAGDAAQQVDPTSAFGGWDGVLEELGLSGAERAELAVSYRCPPDVTALARAVLDGAPPPRGPSVAEARLDGEGHLAAWLVEELRALAAADPAASVAVVCRSPEAARALAQALGRGLDARLALGGRFEFRPGVQVSCVQEVKGLEFDHVVVPDATPASYPALPEERRALYVAVTRATHQLALLTPGKLTPLLAPRG